MVVHKCDHCGREMARWIEIRSGIDALEPYINIGDIWKYAYDKHELCPECYEDFITNFLLRRS